LAIDPDEDPEDYFARELFQQNTTNVSNNMENDNENNQSELSFFFFFYADDSELSRTHEYCQQRLEHRTMANVEIPLTSYFGGKDIDDTRNTFTHSAIDVETLTKPFSISPLLNVPSNDQTELSVNFRSPSVESQIYVSEVRSNQPGDLTKKQSSGLKRQISYMDIDKNNENCCDNKAYEVDKYSPVK
jgi:hypothetical protein